MVVGEVGFSNVNVSLTQIIFGDEIDRSNFESVTEHGKAVFPVGGLPPCEPGKENQEKSCGSRENFRALRKAQGIFCDPPDDQYENPDERDVGVAVSHGLAADLDEADDRHEAAEIPQPACKQITLMKMAQAEEGECQEEEHSQNRFCEADGFFGVRIKNDEMQRPGGF